MKYYGRNKRYDNTQEEGSDNEIRENRLIVEQDFGVTLNENNKR